MSTAEKFLKLFEGSDLVRLKCRPSDTTKAAKGGEKQEARYWTVPGPPTLEDWRSHLNGGEGLGVSPINSKSCVRWGAIDVDLYTKDRFPELVKMVAQSNIPLNVCRSKSGGVHVFLFVDDWIPASDMIEKLETLSAAFGWGTHEIFPKQRTVLNPEAGAPDSGNSLNMPYFGGDRSFRYGVNLATGEAFSSADEFIASVEKNIMPVEAFRELKPPEAPEEIFPDGPPCLNHIFSSNAASLMRNVSLANAAVYLQKARPDNWQDELDRINRLLPDPLPSREVEAIKKSYDKKDYKYQCSKSPLCDHCDASVCKTRTFGIGDQTVLPNNRSLTMLQTVPPIWYMDVCVLDGKPARIELTTEELQSFRPFQKKCMEALQVVIKNIDNKEWMEMVSGMMKHVVVIDMPVESTPKGQFYEYLEDFLTQRASENSYEDILRGLPYKGGGIYYFRFRDLVSYLNNQKFTLLKQNEMQAALQELGGRKDFRKLLNRGVNLWAIPDTLQKQDPFKPKTPEPQPF